MIYVCSLNDDTKETMQGHEVITNLSELYRILVNPDCTEIMLKDDFVENYFTPSGLRRFLEEIRKFNTTVRVILETEEGKNLGLSIESLYRLRSQEELITYILNNRDEAFRTIHQLCEDYAETDAETLEANNKLSTMHLQLSEAESRVRTETTRRESVERSLAENQSRLETLVARINYSYGKKISSDRMFGVTIPLNQYNKIMYIKEITRVKYTDTLLYYLQEVLKTLYGVPVRFVVIESPNAYERARLYPTCKSHIELTYNDVASENIFMAGFQQKLMEDILRNPSKVNYLIILDRSGWKEPFVKGPGVLYYQTVSDLTDSYPGADLSKVISYSHTSLYVPHKEGFENLRMEEKISFYSSTSIIKKLIEDLEGV